MSIRNTVQSIAQLLHAMPIRAYELIKPDTGGMHTALADGKVYHGSTGCNVRSRSQKKRRIHNRQSGVYPKRHK